jgi:exodeoxyribonuclease VII large subunit
MKVTVYGYISLYEKTGQYQLYVQIMEPAGKGALYLAFEQLKERLERAGVFDQKHKKPIPAYPKCVALITSPTGAAVRDMIQISGRRNPSVELVVVPVLVQGENAAADIARAIKEVNTWNGADTIIVGRGGGSIEDLWAFNEEIVARAIFESNIPVISAVGHETDFTIADFVADMRAPTPSAAAELAIPEAANFKDILKNLGERMNMSMSKQLSEKKLIFDRLINTNVLKYPLADITNNEIYVYELYKRLERAITARKERSEMEYRRLSEGLERLSPLGIMSKGYSLVYNAEGRLIKSSADTAVGDRVEIRLADGSVKARIEE